MNVYYSYIRLTVSTSNNNSNEETASEASLSLSGLLVYNKAAEQYATELTVACADLPTGQYVSTWTYSYIVVVVVVDCMSVHLLQANLPVKLCAQQLTNGTAAEFKVQVDYLHIVCNVMIINVNVINSVCLGSV